jgi:hypothetical protein
MQHKTMKTHVQIICTILLLIISGAQGYARPTVKIISEKEAASAIKKEQKSGSSESLILLADLNEIDAACPMVPVGELTCVVCPGEQPVCFPTVRCPPYCLDSTESATITNPAFWASLWSKRAARPEIKIPAKARRFKIDRAARSWLHKNGAVTVVALRGRDKKNHRILLISGLKKDGSRIAPRGYYVLRV